jgi:hypothetical protein
MSRYSAPIIGAFGIFSSSAFGQAALIAPAPAVQPTVAVAPMIVAPPTANILRAGTEVLLKMSEGLTTKGKNLRVGQRFQMEVADNVTLNGQTVIPTGSPATGELTDVRNKGMWGKSGRINARVLFVRVNGRQIRLTGAIDDKGVTGTAGVVASVALIPLAGFFTTGTSAKIPLGAPIKAFLDEDLTVAFVPAAGPAPLVVPAAMTPAAGAAAPAVAVTPASIQ